MHDIDFWGYLRPLLPFGGRAKEAQMPRRNEYTGEACECGHPTYFRVVQVGSRPESRRGPSCWHEGCPRHAERLVKT